MKIKLTKVSDREYTRGPYTIKRVTIAGYKCWSINTEFGRMTTTPDLDAVRTWIQRREEA